MESLGKRSVFALGVLCLILAGLIYLTSDTRSQVSVPEMALREVLAPVQNGLAVAARWTEEAVAAVASLPRLRAENRELRRTVAVLEAQVFAARRIQRENEQLRRALALNPRLPEKSVVARVVGRPAEHWFATLIINRGQQDGVAQGSPVVDVRGAVGHVESVTPNTARVILLVDPKSAVGGVAVGTEAPVLVEGTGDPSGNEALVHPLVHGSGLSVGDEVVTSGMSRIFPKGIPIGRIQRVEERGPGQQPQGILRPYVDFARLDWVSVIVDPADEVRWPTSDLPIAAPTVAPTAAPTGALTGAPTGAAGPSDTEPLDTAPLEGAPDG